MAKAKTPKKGKKVKQRTGPYLFPLGATPRATSQGVSTNPGNTGTGGF